MRIERVVARAFGPFRDRTLELAPGMTVVAGPNESGKSIWHAALRLAVTGRAPRQGPRHAGRAAAGRAPSTVGPAGSLGGGGPAAARRRPDSSTSARTWEAKVACRAVDVALGRDVSDEIMDGTPDASRWLGLDRDSFAATVAVGQAQIMAVADAAESLQEQMQRAAATRGTDATAAEAIARLEQFRKDAVGADTVAAKGPLRTARNRLQRGRWRARRAQRQHADYLERSGQRGSGGARSDGGASPSWPVPRLRWRACRPPNLQLAPAARRVVGPAPGAAAFAGRR